MLMSSAYWLTRVHCRGFHGHSKAAVTSEHLEINIGHRVKSLCCRALRLDKEKCLKMEAEFWLNGLWPQFPIQKRKDKSLLGATNEQRPLTTAEWSSEIPLFTGLYIIQFLISLCITFNVHVKSKYLINVPFSVLSVKLYCPDNGD